MELKAFDDMYEDKDRIYILLLYGVRRKIIAIQKSLTISKVVN